MATPPSHFGKVTDNTAEGFISEIQHATRPPLQVLFYCDVDTFRIPSSPSQLKFCVTIVLLALIAPPAASFNGMRRGRRPRTIYDNHSLFPVTLPPLPLPDTGYDTVDELAEEYVERPIDRLRCAWN